jgi:adenosylcobyric acid synthase
MVTRAKCLLVGGTASHVGKSWTATAICRHLRRRGIRVAPFKAQNMSLNSYPCHGGGEIGRAQVAQAEACGLEPVSDMNPILLKPNSSSGSQVIVDGKIWRDLAARQYYEHFDFLLGRVLEAYERLASQYEYIVIEGAGSIAEINLRPTDLVNMGLATRIHAPVLLVADIDRGGVFSSIIGTFCLLPPEEQKLVRSFAVNRFRGDALLFASGVDLLEKKTARKCLGVFPYTNEIPLDAEDSVCLEANTLEPESNIAIVHFPRVSNFTDFQRLPAAWIAGPVDRRFQFVILPGTKNTIGDLEWMRSRGLDEWVLRQHAAGATVIGICGGYQMLGRRIDDSDAVESPYPTSAEGLGLLPVSTVLLREKTTRVVHAAMPGGARFEAYEIHMGKTTHHTSAAPFAMLADGPEGMRHNRCIGTYLHGALENDLVIAELFGFIPPPRPGKDAMYDRLADWFERHANLRTFEELYL